jgi:hypothetical protein
MPLGTYQIKLVKTGYVTWESTVQTLTVGSAITFNQTLLGLGSVVVNSNPTGAKIWFKYNGAADWADLGSLTNFTTTSTLTGTYQIRLTKAGYADWESTVETLTVGGTLTFNPTLTPLGTVTVNSNPTGGQIWFKYNGASDYVDSGAFTNMTTTSALAGTYQVKVTKSGYVDWESTVQTLVGGGALTFDAGTMTAAGTMIVNTTPAGGRIFFSYNGGGMTDSGFYTNHTATGAPVGTYQVKVVKDGYKDLDLGTQTLTGGGTITFSGTMTSLFGTVVVNSTPAGAKILYAKDGGGWVDSMKVTNATLRDMLAGNYQIKLTMDKYTDYEQTLTLMEGSTATVVATLVKKVGDFTVTSSPGGAKILYSVDGGGMVDSGQTTPHTFTDMEPGTYKVRLDRTGYEAWEQTQLLGAGDALLFDGTLVASVGDISVGSNPTGARIWYSLNGGGFVDSGVETPSVLEDMPS